MNSSDNNAIKTDLSALNDAQRQAVVSEAKRLLILAGAGSGKTKTLLQKIIYLIEEKGVSPSNILAITFTKNAANEMIDRLIISADEKGDYEKILTDKYKSKQEKDNARYYYVKKFKWIDNLTVKTFHSFCFSTLREYGVGVFDNQFRIIGEEKRDEDDVLSKYIAPETAFEAFHKITIELCDNAAYLLDLKRFILDYMVDRIHIEKKSQPQSSEGKYYSTLNGEKVRSKSEQYIADWLYRHSIAYEYEPLLNVKDFDFHPDFYIPDANLYIEHVSNVSYPTRDKEEQFKLGQLTLIKTYESMMEDSVVFNHTLDKIFKNHLPENYVPRTLLFREEFNRYYEEVKDFVRLVMRVTDMMKVENRDIDAVFKNSQKDQHERVRTFYKAAFPIIKKYIAYCINKSFLDFNDLISTTIKLLTDKQDIIDEQHRRYKYILVDEFQDVNNLQVELVKLLLTDNTQLFCVGDDWQSIYGFRGSNVSYIVEFEKHFPDAEVIKLNLNYRSTQHIVGASNEVIKHNKFKVAKDISALKLSDQKIIVYSGGEDDENVDFCVQKIKELLKSGMQGDDIMFLYRRSKMFSPYLSRFKHERIRVQGKTIHAAKGLEAKAVFIVGLSEGPGGFPDIWLEDRIFQVVKKSDFNLLMEEERRLFYVAITRARDKLFLITDKGNESSFLKEIPQHYLVRTAKPIKSMIDTTTTCPACFNDLEKPSRFCPNCGFKLFNDN